MYRNSVDRKVE
ncbi:hypothetical protein BDFB_010745 [Asbolus verrucosus]|uniref:Uncharacterized protein n=1 Tax=Asbolus verrucosus TaxID=1661398 RepID=A0A482WDJ8_ASBVE|nr:hypothetical protein BDFB_010745 [Asbolus verrucosus]